MGVKLKKTTNPSSELGLLRRIRHLASGGSRRGGVRLGIGDDCAILRVQSNEEIAITTDLSLDGRHFRLGWHPPECVGHRALARGLSDLAAMGARPLAAFLSLGLPGDLTSSSGRAPWIERFYKGFLALADAQKTPLAGGDLAESPLALADVVLVGAVPKGRALLRSTARPGDALYVTGWLGGASAALLELTAIAAKQPESTRTLRIPLTASPRLRPHLYPQPRISQGLWLRRRQMASAAIDISDGLSTDLAHLCDESGVAAELDTAALPLAPGATLDQALHGGEDYELLFTTKASKRLPKSIAGVPITRIGRIVRRRPGSPQILFSGPRGREPLEPHGWEHFSLK
jgi:thiamine-monophosphate kinase